MFLHYIDLSWRSFKRTPLVTALMVVAIAVGIGITMTSLSVYHMMAMDPLPHKSDKLFQPQLATMDESNGTWTEDNLPLQMTYKDSMALYRADTPGLKAPSVRTGYSVHLNDDKIKPFIEGIRVTSNDFFSMFDIEFLYGGAWTQTQEDKAELVTVINKELNDKLFGGENSVGKLVYFDKRAFRVVGVFQNFDFHIKYYDVNNGAFNEPEKAMIPVTLIEPLEIGNWGNTNGWKFEEVQTFQDKLRSEQFWMQFWVQLDTPQDVAQYREFLHNYLAEEATKGRFERTTVYFGLKNLREWLDYNEVVTEDNRVLVGLSFMFLAVCLANILGLLLGKFLKRVPEVGVRRALGASKRQIFFQHLVEVSLLGLIGGVIGIGLAQLGLWGVRATYDYYSALATMDLSMLFAAPIIAISACVIAGLYPAWLVCRTNPAICLKTQ
ncbi:ABC transporter permease [Alteromonas facilis]|uniref:ABC transporter permease n=1 Tax=Alteromonas facilis TaxID=2048004 RepID=UPI000C28259C|nr:ABC transporter permease [Alteromonas facilis]